MAELKADLHTHSADDPRDELSHSSEMLIDAAAQLNFRVLALTCHEEAVTTRRLREYARRRGVLLVGGIETCIEGKHLVILNPDEAQCAAKTFEELRDLGRREAAFIAPHPYYPSFHSLGRALEANIDLFDAIEYCTMYFRWATFNRKAVRIARKYGLPLMGSSDVHKFPYCDSTHTRVHAEATIPAVIEAIRAGHVTLETRPQTFWEGMGIVLYTMHCACKEGLGRIGGIFRRQSK